MTTPRIAMLGSFPPQTQGVQSYCGPLAEALGHVAPLTAIGFKRMYPPLVFPGVQQPLDPTWPAPTAPQLDLRLALTWYNPAAWCWHAARTPCDVFHAQWWSLPLFPVTATFVATMRRRGKPIVLTLHNVVPHEPAPRFERATEWLCNRADRIFVHGARNREQAMERYGLPASRVVTVPFGASPPPPITDTPAEARARLGLPAYAPLILFFGIIRPYKGLHDLIEAFASIARAHPAARLVIAGKPWEDWAPYAERIRARGLEERVITRLEFVPQDEVQLYYRACDANAIPYTHFDAQSGVGTLSLAHAIPTVVTRTGALPDWVDNQPEWVVPPEDPVALGDALGAILSDLPAKRAAFEALAARMRETTSWGHVAETHLEVYRQALDARESHGPK